MIVASDGKTVLVEKSINEYEFIYKTKTMSQLLNILA